MTQIRKLTLVQWYWLNCRLYSYFSTPSPPASYFCSSPWRSHTAVRCHISLVSLPADSFSVCLQSCRNLIFLSQLHYKMPPNMCLSGTLLIVKVKYVWGTPGRWCCILFSVTSGVHHDDISYYWWTLSIWLRWYLSGSSNHKVTIFPFANNVCLHRIFLD